ncbi:hypothetical protein [Xylella taiwanensis]|nr:hypothetical protein [Xylella taiwanensis]
MVPDIARIKTIPDIDAQGKIALSSGATLALVSRRPASSRTGGACVSWRA